MTFRRFTARAVVWVTLVALLTVGAIWMVSRALAHEMPCFRDAKLAQLALGVEHDEAPIAAGTVNGNAVHIYVSPARTFTVLVTTPGGPACVVVSREDFEFFTPRPRPKLPDVTPGEDS